MPRVCIPHVIISSAAFLGITMMFFDFNIMVYKRVTDLIDSMWCETEEEMETRWKKEIEERRRRRREEEEEGERRLKKEIETRWKKEAEEAEEEERRWKKEIETRWKKEAEEEEAAGKTD